VGLSRAQFAHFIRKLRSPGASLLARQPGQRTCCREAEGHCRPLDARATTIASQGRPPRWRFARDLAYSNPRFAKGAKIPPAPPASTLRPPMSIDVAKIEHLTRELLSALGEDPDREGLLKTPERVAKAMAFLTSGYRTDVDALINGAIFTQTTNSMVIVKNIEVYSLCEHHMLPFFGRCHIGYIPTGRVFGVSKLARLVDMYSRRLQLQERLTEQISQAVFDSIDARGVGVMIEAQHLCMMMRGVEKQNSEMITSSVLGTFRESEATRDEFLALIGPRG
jgi:GTP cyclohydrolase IA